MIRGSGLRGSSLREDEDVQPMQYVANLTDVMLVLACGLMAADKLDKIDAADVIESSGNVSTGGLTNKGVVYEDPETGDLYIIEN